MADKSFNDLIPARNADVHRRHRKEVFWQITFPMILASLVLLGVCSLTVFIAMGQEGAGLWRDISLIWMISPALILSLIPFAIFAGMAYGIVRLIGVLPGFFFKVQRFLTNLTERIESISNRLASPIIRVGSFLAGLRKLKG